jgi:cysteine-rich repeat protein
MRLALFTLAVILAVVTALPGQVPGGQDNSSSAPSLPPVTYSPITLYITPTSSYPLPTTLPPYGGDCGLECGGVCGDGIVQRPQEQCDLGPKLNGAPNSGCSKDCQYLPVCGNGKVEPEAGEEVSRSSQVNI